MFLHWVPHDFVEIIFNVLVLQFIFCILNGADMYNFLLYNTHIYTWYM